MNFNNSPYDPRTLNNLFFFLLFGQIFLFGLALYYVNQNNATFQFIVQDVSAVAIPIMIALSNIIANKIFNQQWNKIAEEKDLDEKLQIITRAHLIQWALVEGGTLLLLVFAVTDKNHYYNILAVINILYFITLRPKIISPNSEMQANA